MEAGERLIKRITFRNGRMETLSVENTRHHDTTAGPCHDYKVFGFSIRSCMAFPEMSSHFCLVPDVTIRYGYVPDALECPSRTGVCFQAAPGLFLLILKGIARYRVAGGKDIMIERAEGATDADVRLFLLGPVMGALLHQRGALPLHASAVKAADETAILFAGESGTGKSTLAAALHRQGYPVLSDDICAVHSVGGSPPILYPGLRELQLWSDAARKLGMRPEDLPPTRTGMEKYYLRDHEAAADPLPIKHVYILHMVNHPGFEIQKLRGMEKIEELAQQTYQMPSLGGTAKEAVHFRQCASLGAQTEISRVFCPRGDFRPNKLADLLEKDFT